MRLLVLLLLFKASFASELPKHHIVLIHGIGGSEKTFGHMAEALTRQLGEQNPSTQYEVRSFNYDTFSKTKKVNDFAQELGEFVDSLFPAGSNSKDQVSFIAHSQGGLVFLLWLYRAAMLDEGFSSMNLKRVDAFVSLATPFWGSKMAHFISPSNDLARILGQEFLFGYGANQLFEMSFGSEVIDLFREAVLEYEDALMRRGRAPQEIPPVRMLNVGAGLFDSGEKLLGKALFGEGQIEDDLAVMIPSSRFEFYYARDINPRYLPNHVTAANAFKKTSLGNFTVVKAVHMDAPLPAMPPPVAFVPSECASDPACNHPAYSLVLNHLLKNTHPSPDVLEGKLTGFIVDLKVRTPPESNLDDRDVIVEFPARKSKWRTLKDRMSGRSDSKVRVAKTFEILSTGSKSGFVDSDHHRLFFTGSVTRSPLDPTSEYELEMIVKAAGHQPRRIQAKVSPGFTTFVDINLVKR